MVVEQCFQAEGACLMASDWHRHTFYHILLVAQNRQHMLLSIAEVGRFCQHTHAHQVDIFWYLKTELHTARLACIHREACLLCAIYLLIHRIEEYEAHLTLSLFLAHILNGSGNLRLISYAQEARHVRTQHKVFRGGDLLFYSSHLHIFGMGIAHKAPTREAFWNGERNHYFSLLVGM